MERRLIAVEIKLGTLNLQVEHAEDFPEKTGSIQVHLGSADTRVSLRYNVDYRRIFGLVGWYRDVGAKAGDRVRIEKLGDGVYRLTHLPTKGTGTCETAAAPSEAEERASLDLSGLDPTAKGRIVEDRIKDIILLFGQGELHVYRPVVDRVGVDLVVVKSGSYHPLFLQVKSRFNLQGNSLIFNVTEATFHAHASFYIVGAYFDPVRLEIHDRLLLIPSKKVPELANKIRPGGKRKFQVNTSIRPEVRNPWSEFFCSKEEFVSRLLDKFSELETYLR